MMNDFSTATADVRRQWNIIKLLKENNCPPRIVYSAYIFFKNEVN